MNSFEAGGKSVGRQESNYEALNTFLPIQLLSDLIIRKHSKGLTPSKAALPLTCLRYYAVFLGISHFLTCSVDFAQS